MPPEAVAEAPAGAMAAAGRGAAARSLLLDYVALTKPRVISLLLVTTLCAMFVAEQGMPGGWLILWTMAGGYLSAGGANAINQYVDRDIDALMRRTTGRPIVAGRMTPRHALGFGIACGVTSFVGMGLLINWLAAALALAGLLLYVFLYTLWLKRTTIHNIVIGGASGAIPPLVGWAAVANDLPLAAWLLFAIVFYWTPPHFWALALILRRDYSEAGVPMLPVVYGEAATRRQVLTWSLVLVGVTLLPSASGDFGAIYTWSALVLGAVFIAHGVALVRQREEGGPWARRTFSWSLLYLALLFVAMVVDRVS
ncbi:MAG: heme o synthase [Thermoleophilia bacterium]|nr:heme o synthase [Thermoleophilia bacterium]